MSGLRVADLTVRAGQQTLVDAASFAAPAGAVTGLIGPNGAGKSTLMRAAIGLGPRLGGTVMFGETDVLALPRLDRARLCAFVEQSATTEARLSVRDVVGLGRLPFQAVWQTGAQPGDAAIVAEALGAVDMSGFAERQFNTLSGGEQQRVHLARAFAQTPRLLLLDEPTSHLDVRAQLDVLELLRARAGTGLTVLLAIHDLNLAAAFCDHLVVMRGGRIVAQGSAEELLTPHLLGDVYGVTATVLPHPLTGRPLVAFGG